MAQPVGDERTARPDAAGDEPSARSPVPTTHPADEAEDAARIAVEGVGIDPERR